MYRNPAAPPAIRQFLIFSLLVALLAGLPYLPGLPGEFVFDDMPNIVNNESIQLKELTAESLAKVVVTPQISGQMRSLPTLTFALDYWRGGGADPATFKTTNILIHMLTAFALAWLFRSLLLVTGTREKRAHWLATALALAWAVHPLMVSSVLYTVQRLQTMGTLFLVLALLAYLQARRAQIGGRSGRTCLLGAALLWVAAMGCKEDSSLLPAYTLALELTVLRFSAADQPLANHLRRGYMVASLIGAGLYLFVVIPHYWAWNAYDGRDFSTPERLLTQARVLCLYLWQILVPLPSHMPFYYDWLQPSRGLFQPWTTLPAILLLLALLGVAWRLRARQPLFTLGVLLFFSAHFITSNVVGLELAFEHRNHFAMIGAVLAIGSLLAHTSKRLHLHPKQQAGAYLVVLLTLSTATAFRAHSWSSNLIFSKASTAAAPHSARAWIELCSSEFEAGGGAIKGNSHIGEAILACGNGTRLAPYALNNAALLIVLKTLKGNVNRQDWELFQHQLETVSMSWDNQRAPTILTYHAHTGVMLNKQQLLKTLTIWARYAPLKPFQTAQIGYFVLNDLDEPDQAMPYFIKAINSTNPTDSFPQELSGELRNKGRTDLADEIIQLDFARKQAARATNF
ncbi:hypothetical protein [Thermomonas paludicola]|uniref:hypothetical protein n=1 Tax=Thermomonas paludicola TaxID=2884874 RepID=UPI002114967B|nr:hypothetical protein [Thermomonas paludicola]